MFRGNKLKLALTTSIIVVLTFNCMGRHLGPLTNDQQLTDSEVQEARQLAIEFTTGFVRKGDLTLLVKDLFLNDFIERYRRAKAKDLTGNRSVDLYFVPGLDYNSRLLSEASPEDWLRFYTAANNFVFFGFMSVIKNSRNPADISATNMYPPSVIKLLNTNPNLSNMIVRKGKSDAVGSVAEMHKATATLEQAASLMRRKWKGKSPVNIDEKGLVKAVQEDEFFKPTMETVDDQFFGLPQGTRVVFINTPILFRLMLVKANNKLEVLWAEPYIGG